MRVFICGEPRTGKTTLCKKLKEKLSQFNLFVTEAFRNGFQKMDEEHYREWGTKTSIQRVEQFPIFLKEFLQWNEELSQQNSLIDSALLPIQDALKIKKTNDLIICLGFGGKPKEEIFKTIHTYENEQDYTKNFADDYLLRLWGDIEANDIFNKNFCKENNLLYIDTSTNRDTAFDTVLQAILSKV